MEGQMKPRPALINKAGLAILLVVIISIVTTTVVEAATYYSNPYWVRINYFASHQSYGVFIIRTGHSNLRLYFMKDGSSGWYLGNSQCAVNPVVGPGYINDPGGMYSAYVPSGYVGMAICGSTSTLLQLRLLGYNVYDRSRWRLYYDR
jgi:hypothetical protein